MFKLLTAVVLFSTLSISTKLIAAETSEFSTKSLVRISLWYEGLNSEIQVKENQRLKSSPMSEGLEKALFGL